MWSPSTLKIVQQLTGRIAALSRFLARFKERVHPFFYLLKKQVGFERTDECERVFQDLKKFLVELQVLNKPRDRELLYVYLSITEKVISLVLVRED